MPLYFNEFRLYQYCCLNLVEISGFEPHLEISKNEKMTLQVTFSFVVENRGFTQLRFAQLPPFDSLSVISGRSGWRHSLDDAMLPSRPFGFEPHLEISKNEKMTLQVTFSFVVENRGFEPLASALRTQRDPNFANSPGCRRWAEGSGMILRLDWAGFSDNDILQLSLQKDKFEK
jgi:hypothetical protein